MTSPLAEFINGVTGGVESGYGFARDLSDRRRKRTLEDREQQRRDFERGRADVERAQETGIEYVPSRVPDELARFDERTRRGVSGWDEGLGRRVDEFRRGVGNALLPQTDMVDTSMPRIRGLEDRVQFGGFEKVRPSADEQQAIDTELQSAELAAAVGNALAARDPSLGIEPGSREAMLLGMGKLPTEPARWEPRTREEQLQWLHDTGVLAQRMRASTSAAGAGSRQDLATVERQVDDTRADLARAERDLPPPFSALDAAQRQLADSAAYEGARAPLLDRATDLRARADSLGTVRDSLAAEVQGRPFRRAPTKTPAEWVAEVRLEHPGWAPERVADEARRRAGVR